MSSYLHPISKEPDRGIAVVAQPQSPDGTHDGLLTEVRGFWCYLIVWQYIQLLWISLVWCAWQMARRGRICLGMTMYSRPSGRPLPPLPHEYSGTKQSLDGSCITMSQFRVLSTIRYYKTMIPSTRWSNWYSRLMLGAPIGGFPHLCIACPVDQKNDTLI